MKFRERRNVLCYNSAHIFESSTSPKILDMVADSQVELIDGHVSAKQCKKAVEALLKHEVKRQAEQQESQLLPGKEQSVWLGVTLKQMHPEKKLKPHRMYGDS